MSNDRSIVIAMPLKTLNGADAGPRKGRGAAINPEGRFENTSREGVDDGWNTPDETRPLRTTITIEPAKSIISHNDSPDVGFTQSINPYAGCEHGCAYCMHGDTPILMADGSTRVLADLRVGDEIYGTRGEGAARHYARSRVLARWSVIKPAHRITLLDGTTLVASADHRLLARSGWKYVAEGAPPDRPQLTPRDRLIGTGAFCARPPIEHGEYRRGYLRGVMIEARAYAAGNAVHLAPRSMIELDVWPSTPTPSWSAGFLAAMFDEHGSFGGGVLELRHGDPRMIDWTARCLRAFDFDHTIERDSRAQHDERLARVRVHGGLREHLRFFHTADPRARGKLDLTDLDVPSSDELRVVAIEPLGAMPLFDITTDTEDFIANGVVSHNCFARPSHAYRNLSPGIDFETRIFAKTNAAELLRKELSRPGYQCSVIAIGVNTDAYQPIERELRITRSILEVCAEFNQPVGLITKNATIERDLDIIAPMAAKRLVTATISLNNLDHDVARRLEPRCAAPTRRLQAMRTLSEAGVPVRVLLAPVIPFITDHQIERVLEAAREHGATAAGYVLLRLPWEVKDIFREWLERHYPLKAKHVMSRVHDMRGGRDNDPRFGTRMTGLGELAHLLEKRFELACRRLGFDSERDEPLDTTLFRVPADNGGQLPLF